MSARLSWTGRLLSAGATAGLCLAAGGAPKAGELKPPPVDDVEQMCALFGACEGVPVPQGMVPQDFPKCVRAMSEELAKPSGVGFSLTIRECGLRANTCAELRTCALRGAKADACVGRGGQGVAGFCDADGRALSCSKDKILAVRDCPRGGEQCAVRSGEAYCALGPCPTEMTEGAAPVCSGSGTRILRCEKGKLVSLDCAAFGLKCVMSAGAAACAPDTAACGAPDGGAGASRCEGQVAIGCHHGREVRVDCAAAGLACGGAGAAVGACTMPAPKKGDECDPAAPARCEGATIKYCAAGRARSYPCKATGFNRCVTDGKGARCGA
jgi:hypothetical protein